VRFKQVDVFTRQPLHGNPLAVVLEADGLDSKQMQHIARWTNLSETSFVLSPDAPGASYRLRIFTPASELPFAGHPSVGSAHALIEAGLVRPDARGGLVQQCGAGLLPLQIQDEAGLRSIAVRSPEARSLTLQPSWTSLLDAALGDARRGDLPAVLYDNGPVWWLQSLATEQEVREHSPNQAAIAALCRSSGAVGLALFAEAEGGDYQQVVRAFCPADGIPEDPVTGSANAAIGAYLHQHGRLPSGAQYVASQGRELGRDGRVQVRIAADGAWIGGACVTVVDGSFRLA
jgi:PhzF family phenazine biosynthesis protein